MVDDEVGYIPLDPDAAVPFFALVRLLPLRAGLGVRELDETFSAGRDFGDPVDVGHGGPARAPR